MDHPNGDYQDSRSETKESDRESFAQDPLLLYAFSVVGDFLSRHKLSKTLEVFEEEWQSRHPSYKPSIENWYRISRALDFPGKLVCYQSCIRIVLK